MLSKRLTFLFILALWVLSSQVQAGYPVSLKPLPSCSILEDSSWSLSLNEYFKDPDGMKLTFKAESTVDSILAWVDDSILHVSPMPDWFGDFNLIVLVTSKSGQGISRILNCVVHPVNDPPRLQSYPPVVHLVEDVVGYEDLTPYMMDPDGQIVSVSSEPGNVSIDLVGQRLRFKSPKNWNGSETVKISITDDKGAITHSEIQVMVAPVNDAPTLSAMPQSASIQANGSLVIEFSALVNDVDDSVSSLRVQANPLPGMRLRTEGTRLIIMPVIRLDTVTVSGVVTDSSGGTAPFSLRVFCNAGFQKGEVNLQPNLPLSNSLPQPTLLINNDGSWDVISMSDSAVFLNRYRPDGSQKVPGRALWLNALVSASQISVKRDSNVYFILSMVQSNLGNSMELHALDSAFHETAKFDFSREYAPEGYLELDTQRKRVLVTQVERRRDSVSATLTTFDYGLQQTATKRFHTVTPQYEQVSDKVPGRYYNPGMSNLQITVLPNKYLLFWGANLRSSKYLAGIQYASVSPNLVQIDSNQVLDVFVDEVPATPLNNITSFQTYTHLGSVFLIWKFDEISASTMGTSQGPTIRIQRFDAELKPMSPIKMVSSGNSWYRNFQAPLFTNSEVLVPWSTSDSYPTTPREYFLVHFTPELNLVRTELVAKDTLNSYPERHLRNGEVYLISRLNLQGELKAWLAEGGIPTYSLSEDCQECRRKTSLAKRSPKVGETALPGFDIRGRKNLETRFRWIYPATSYR